jgi:TatD DNase family protein
MELLIDSHAHLTYDKSLDIPAILARAKSEGISHIINICSDQHALSAGILLKETYPYIYNTAAVAPHDVKDGEKFWPSVEKYAKANMLIAIGETGLDYYYHKDTKDLQIEFLKKHIDLAHHTKLPFSIHCREAFDDLFAIFTGHFNIPSILHCFTGSLDEAKKTLDKGWYISFSGIITYKNSGPLQEVVRYVPLNRMVLETDSPYLAPQKFRGKKNEPAFLIETAKQVALLKNEKVEEVIHQTSINAKKIFNLK